VKENNQLISLNVEDPESRSLVEKSALPYLPSRNLEAEADEKIHLRDYWLAARKRIWLILSITLLVTALTTVYMANKPDIYEAEARIQVNLESPNPALGATSKNGSVIVNSYNDPTFFGTQMQILTGPGLLRRVTKTLDLEHNQTFLHPDSLHNTSTWQNILRAFGLRKPPRVVTPDPAQGQLPLTSEVAPASAKEDLTDAKRLAPYVKALQDNLTVEPVKETRLSVRDTHLIDISFRHSDPLIAAKVVNTIADTFALSNLEKKTESNTTTGDYLQKRIAELQAQIRADGERLSNYAKNHQILSLDASQNTVVERLAGLNRQLLEAENERELAEAAYRAAQQPGAANALAEGSVTQINDLEQKLGALRQQRALLLVENTEDWPEVANIDSQIKVLEKEIADTRARSSTTVVTNLKTRYEQAKAREQALEASFKQQRGETVTQNEASINYRLIQQELETNKALLDGLMQRSKENDVVQAGTPNNIYVVDYAVSPDAPVAPRRLRGIALAFALSLVFGVGLAFFLEYLDDTIRSTEDVEKMLHLPTLTVIPMVGSLVRRRFLPKLKSLKSNGHGAHPELLSGAGDNSGLAEAYRQLRTSVLLSTPGQYPQTLLVTSSLPSEGKTTTAVNIAMSLAQTGSSVLVVDADMRRPRLHSIFGLGNHEGLSTILSKKFDEESIKALIARDEESGLYLLTSGAIPPNPAELIGSQQMKQLLAFLKPHYEHIIIDSPPIASFTDGILISLMADGTLLVIHGGKSSRAVVRHARQQLRNVGAKLLGVVLNKVDLHSADYYYYYHHYNHYKDYNGHSNGNGSGHSNGKELTSGAER
jgi:polysaccharide biosynthesis transport protein